MPFTATQKAKFVALLQTKGWQLRDGIIWSPSGGLHFSDAHFSDRTSTDVRELFAQRAERLQRYQALWNTRQVRITKLLGQQQR